MNAEPHDALVWSARSWSNVAALAQTQLEIAKRDPLNSPTILAFLESAARVMVRCRDSQLDTLRKMGFPDVAANILETTPGDVVPLPFRLAESPLDAAEGLKDDGD